MMYIMLYMTSNISLQLFNEVLLQSTEFLCLLLCNLMHFKNFGNLKVSDSLPWRKALRFHVLFKMFSNVLMDD